MKKLLFFILVLAMAAQTAWAQQKAQFILFNGKIFTSNPKLLYAQAIAISGNKIIAVGRDGAVLKVKDARTRLINLQGRTVVPGFNDAHDHLGWITPPGLCFADTTMGIAGLSKTAVLDSIARLLKTALPGQWISGPIGTAVLNDQQMRHKLDSIAPNNPVLLQIWWGHGEVINHKALQASGIADGDADPLGGWYVKDPVTHQITSVQENAAVPIWNTWMDSDRQGVIRGLRVYAQQQVEHGITTVQQMSSAFSAQQSAFFFREARLPQRIRIIAWPKGVPSGRSLHPWDKFLPSTSLLVYSSGIKYVVDGTSLEKDQLNKKPFADGTFGRLNFPPDTIRQILKEALHSNRQLMLHITGDSTFKLVLNMMKQLAPGPAWAKKRVRIEHNAPSLRLTDGDIDDIKHLGLLLMHTPKYCQHSPLASLLAKGIKMGISPDGTSNPFLDMLMVTTQQTSPGENLTREQAVIAYTATNAYAEFAERKKGTLMPGMLADLAVLSQDIFTIPAKKLPATKSVLTMVNGKIVYTNGAL